MHSKVWMFGVIVIHLRKIKIVWFSFFTHANGQKFFRINIKYQHFKYTKRITFCKLKAVLHEKRQVTKEKKRKRKASKAIPDYTKHLQSNSLCQRFKPASTPRGLFDRLPIPHPAQVPRREK